MQPAEDNLIEVLDEQIGCATEMIGTLARENRALIDDDPEQLNEASAGKAKLVEMLENLELERRALSSTTITPSQGVAAEKWEQLLALLEECRSRNLQNGSLVQAKRQQVLTVLKLLRGPVPEVYDAEGNEETRRGTQRLGSA